MAAVKGFLTKVAPYLVCVALVAAGAYVAQRFRAKTIRWALLCPALCLIQELEGHFPPDLVRALREDPDQAVPQQNSGGYTASLKGRDALEAITVTGVVYAAVLFLPLLLNRFTEKAVWLYLQVALVVAHAVLCFALQFVQVFET